MESLNMLPGHRGRMYELFRLIDQLNPRNNVRQTLRIALKQSAHKRIKLANINSDLMGNQDTEQKSTQRKASLQVKRRASQSK